MEFDVNLVAVLVAALVMMAVGSIWYSSTLFGSVWMKLVGQTEETLNAGRPMWKAVAVAYVLQFLALYVLAHFLILASAVPGASPLVAAAWSAVLVGLILAMNVWWERRSWSYFLNNISYTFIMFVGGGCIITYWPW